MHRGLCDKLTAHDNNMLRLGRSSVPHLGVYELNDIGVAAQPLQQRDLIDEACSRLAIPPSQPNALQRIYLAVGSHDFVHLCMLYMIICGPSCPICKRSTYSIEPNNMCKRVH